jgi:hypothetical protein
MIVPIPGVSARRNILTQWFFKNNESKYRLITDQELKEGHEGLQFINETYAGIKTVAIISNPWRRAISGYLELIRYREQPDCPAHLFEININSFEDFLQNNNNLLENPNWNKWWDFSTQQIEWINYTNSDGKIETASYILKDENLETDFKEIQSYFENTDIMNFPPLIEYQSYYNDVTRNIVAELFADDIKTFGYTF